MVSKDSLTSWVILVCLVLSSSDARDDFVSTVCPHISKYLQSAYSCRPEKFQRHVACQENHIEMRCPRSEHIAIHSASYGWSDQLTASDCPSAHLYDTAKPDCRRICSLEEAKKLCQGKRRCLLDSQGGATFEQNRCRTGTVKYLGVIYTCVKKSSLRHIESSDSVFINPCDEDNPDVAEPGRSNPPFVVHQTPTPSQSRVGLWYADSSPTQGSDQGQALRKVKVDWNPHVEISIRNDDPFNAEDTTLGFDRRPHAATQTKSLREGSVLVNSGGVGRSRVQMVSPKVQMKENAAKDKPQVWVYALMDWIWTWKYVNDNTEKFVLYMLLGLSLGTIAILVTILFHMVFCVRCSPSKATPPSGNIQQGTTASCSSPTWRMPESESSTGDDRTLHDDDVELTSFNHIDSLQRHTSYHHQTTTTTCRPPSYTGGQQSPTTTTTATINRSYSQVNPVVTRCFTPSPPTMTLAESSAPNGGYLTQTVPLGNGRVEVTPLPPQHCVGSLGRTYPNHYRRDSYQLDPAPGCRTLQPMQHYYG